MESPPTFESDEENILSFLPFGYEYVLNGDIQFRNESNFKCAVNIKNIHSEDDVKEWIARLSECTLTTWRVLRTYPASGRCNIFKIAMKCQHNVNHKFKTTKNRKKHYLSKHTGCPSNMIITIRRYIKNSKSKRLKCSDPSLIDWPCFVDLNFIHNHPLNTAAVLRFRPLGNEIKDKIIALFKKGHSPSSALESIKLELFLDNDEDYFDIAEDGFYIPTHSQVKYLFSQTFGMSSAKDSTCLHPTIEDLINNYNSVNEEGRAEIGRMGDNIFVCVCSPIMFRAHRLLPHSSQIAIIETTGTTDKKGHKIYFIVSPTPAGCIPLGCIVTDGDGKDILNAALSTLKQCFPQEHSFFSQSYPFVVMTDDDINEQEPLKLQWPKTMILFCQYRILKAAWKWLNCYQNVPKPMREEVYYSIKSLIYCPNEKDLFEMYKLLVSKYHSTVPKLITYVNNMWPSRHFWSSAYRFNIPIGGNRESNYVEITFKIMKECILQRIRQYNLIQLIDFILVHYEYYIRRRLLDFTEGKVRKKLLFKYIPPTCIINPSTIIQSEIDESCYFVPSDSDYNIKYMVDVKHCICSCEQGRIGKICKHLCGVISQMENSEDIDVPQDFKDMLYRIATGLEPSKANDEFVAERPPSPLENSANNQSDLFSTTDVLPLSLSIKEQRQLNDFYKCINKGLKIESNLFVPAIKTMLKKFKHMNSDDFITAIKRFGKYSCGSCASVKKSISKKKISKKHCTTKKEGKLVDKNQYAPILPKIENEFLLLYDPLAL